MGADAMKFEPPKRVRCIRAGNSGGRLQEGKIYEAIASIHDGERYRIASIDDESGFFVTRFVDVEVVVSDIVATGRAEAACASPDASMATASFDFETYNSLRGLPGKKH